VIDSAKKNGSCLRRARRHVSGRLQTDSTDCQSTDCSQSFETFRSWGTSNLACQVWPCWRSLERRPAYKVAVLKSDASRAVLGSAIVSELCVSGGDCAARQRRAASDVQSRGVCEKPLNSRLHRSSGRRPQQVFTQPVVLLELPGPGRCSDPCMSSVLSSWYTSKSSETNPWFTHFSYAPPINIGRLSKISRLHERRTRTFPGDCDPL
jgi:hypothetical protein